MGIEPTPLAWEAKVLPLNYTRLGEKSGHCNQPFFKSQIGKAKMIEIFLNGKTQSVEDNCSVAALIQTLDLKNKRLAVEVNLEIVPRSQFEHQILAAGDKVEIVQAIGGG